MNRRTWAAAYWLALAGWAAVVLRLSSLTPDELPDAAFVFSDKLNHFLMYAVGGWLAASALRLSRPSTPALARIALAVVLVAAFGIADEAWQALTPGRSGGDVDDWIADLAGAAAGALLTLAARRRRGPIGVMKLIAVLAASAVVGGVATAAPAQAADPTAFGTYSFTADDGESATWALTPCADDPPGCARVSASGTATRAPWVADAHFSVGSWILVVGQPDAIPCPDGSSLPGTKTYSWDGATLAGNAGINTNGACGAKPSVSVPFRLTRMGAAEAPAAPAPVAAPAQPATPAPPTAQEPAAPAAAPEEPLAAESTATGPVTPPAPPVPAG